MKRVTPLVEGFTKVIVRQQDKAERVRMIPKAEAERLQLEAHKREAAEYVRQWAAHRKREAMRKVDTGLDSVDGEVYGAAPYVAILQTLYKWV